MNSKRLILSLLAILFLAVRAPAAEDDPADAPRTVRLLTVGNSFTGNATRYLPDLAKAGGHRLIHQSLIIGGSPLQLQQRNEQEEDSTQ